MTPSHNLAIAKVASSYLEAMYTSPSSFINGYETGRSSLLLDYHHARWRAPFASFYALTAGLDRPDPLGLRAAKQFRDNETKEVLEVMGWNLVGTIGGRPWQRV